MRTIFIIIIFSISISKLYACDCGKIVNLQTQQERAIARSSAIFIGDVISTYDIDNESYLIKVVEVLKGTIVSDTLEGIRQTTCSMVPKSGRWIFYFDLDFSEKFDYSVCGMSRSFDKPEKVLVEEYVRILESPARKKEYRRFRNNYLNVSYGFK